jgi:hypothetical protein
VGVFHDIEDARDAVEALKDAGFAANEIGLLAHDRERGREVAEETGTHSHVGEGATTALMTLRTAAANAPPRDPLPLAAHPWNGVRATVQSTRPIGRSTSRITRRVDRQRWQGRYGNSGEHWEDYDWERRYPNTPWDRARRSPSERARVRQRLKLVQWRRRRPHAELHRPSRGHPGVTGVKPQPSYCVARRVAGRLGGGSAMAGYTN